MQIIPTLLAFLSGTAALAHQIIWTRRFVDALGADANTFSKVIGAFFVGLALGAAFAPRFIPSANAWRRVACAEVLVSVLAVPALFSYVLGEKLFTVVGGSLWKLLLPIVLIVPPAFAMGMFLPLLFVALPGSTSPAGTVRIYAANTLGGVVGVSGGLLFLLPRLGTTASGLVAVALNVAVALGAAGLARKAESGNMLAPQSPQILISFKTLALLSFGSGYAVLASEVVLQQQLAQVTINSIFSSGFVLMAVLLALGVAGLIVALLPRLSNMLSAVLVGSALLCFLQPFQLLAVRPNLNMLPYELALPQYVVALLKLVSLSVAPLLLISGLLFPLALQAVPVGRIAWLFAWNGLGGWLGTEITQALVLPNLGLWVSMAAIGAVYLIMLVALRQRRAYVLAGCGGVALALTLAFSRNLPQVTINPPERLTKVGVGREGVVATVQSGAGDWRMLFNNSYTLGGSKAQFNQERQALLPLLIHPGPRAVACLGVATGSTVAGATLHPEVVEIDAIELSPLVLEQARTFFAPFNRHVFGNPYVRFIREDARWIMASRAATYDVVVGDLFLPWRTGEGRLFTLEHFENVRASLKPDGLFCQWLPMFQLTRAQFETIARTFQKVFPGAWLVRGDFYTELPILGLVGGKDLSRLDWNCVESACLRLRESGRSTDPLVRHSAGVAMMIIGPLGDLPPGAINTLENGWLEWNAARNIVGMKEPWFIGVPCAEYLRSIHRMGQAQLSPDFREAHDAGQFFLTLEIAAKLHLPAFADLESQVPSRMPRALWRDPGANWQTWPMRVKPSPML